MENNITENTKKDWEIRRSAHLLILFTHTFFTFLLISEDIILGWEYWVLPVLMLQLIFCWSMHLFSMYTSSIRIHIFAGFEFLFFFFYGVHETSFYDLAPVMTILLLLYTSAQRREVIIAGMITYYMTAVFDLILIPQVRPELTMLNLTRLALHFSMVTLGGGISLIIIKSRHTS